MPRFKIGQVVMLATGKRKLPMLILEVIEQDGEFYYRFNRNNSLHEAMLRPLTDHECGR